MLLYDNKPVNRSELRQLYRNYMSDSHMTITEKDVAEDFSSEYDVRLQFFSGPMDLLLHLVSLKEVPIEEVSMSEILDQYCSIVSKQAHKIDLEKASEYLVIITTLMVIKSKALLPDDADTSSEEEADMEYSRFFESLRERLKAFELTRLRAQALIDSPQHGVDTFSRTDKEAFSVPPEMIAEGETSFRLGALFVGLIKRVGGLGQKLRISIEPVSIVDSMMRIVDSLKTITSKASNPFLSVVKNSYSRKDFGTKNNTRNILMGSFVAVLELAKRGVVSIHQPGQNDEISVTLRIHEEDSSSEKAFESEFDNIENKVVSLHDHTSGTAADTEENFTETEVPEKRMSNG
jgi:segregation and condensation protein A